MHIMIKATTNEVKDAKTLIVETKQLKTKANLIVAGDEQSEFFEPIMSDIKTLNIGGKPINDLSVTIEGAPAIGRLVNRSIKVLKQFGLEVKKSLEWDAEAGVVEFKGDILGSDFPIISELMLRLARRACKQLSGTQHPLTVYDFKQATGLVVDAKEGLESAEVMLKWCDDRELVTLEAEKKKAEKEKEKAKAKDRLKRHKPGGPEKNRKSKKKKGGAAAGVSLTDLK